MKLKNLLLAFMGIISLSLAMTGCTADDESTEPSGAKYAYTKAELQEIADLQEEYGVELTDFTKVSDEPLPTVDEMHELIAIVAEMQSSLNHETSREEGRVVFSNENRKVRTHRMTPKRDMENYSGSKSQEGECGYGAYSFTITWEKIEATGLYGNFNIEHHEVANPDWYFEFSSWSHSFSGAQHLDYTVNYRASMKKKRSSSAQFKVSGDIFL